MRVLLVDSDPVHLDVWGALLSYVGYEVAVARNCLEAALLLSQRFDCVILDYRLPDMSGIDFIRYFASPQGMSFILMTDNDRPLVHLRAVEAGASLSLVKPSPVRDVVEAVEQACSTIHHVAPLHYQGCMIARGWRGGICPRPVLTSQRPPAQIASAAPRGAAGPARR